MEIKTTTDKKRAGKIVICNRSVADAKMTLEEMVKRYLLKKVQKIEGNDLQEYYSKKDK